MKFDAETYAQYRPVYPPALYLLLKSFLEDVGTPRPWRIVDLGCGSGQSTLGLVQAMVADDVIAIDPDPEMLSYAQNSIQLRKAVRFVEAPGEKTLLPTASVSAVMVCSALHWMKVPEVLEEALRVLKSSGVVFLCEYQFPKSQNHPQFDEWVREKFRGDWQLEVFRKRGSFADLIQPFVQDTRLRSLGFHKPQMQQTMGWQEMFGLLRSQSRFCVQLQNRKDEAEREKFIDEIGEEVHRLLGEDEDSYDFNLIAAGFAKF